MTEPDDLLTRMRTSAVDVEFEDAHDPHRAAKVLREGAARIEQLEIQLEAVREANASLATDAGLWAKPAPGPLRLLKRAGVDFFVLGLTLPDPEDANGPPGLEVSFERVGDTDAFLDALPYGPRASGATREEAARALLAKLQADIADPTALFMKLSDAAGREADEVDTDEDQLAQSELWEAQKVWALAAGIVAAASPAPAATAFQDGVSALEQALAPKMGCSADSFALTREAARLISASARGEPIEQPSASVGEPLSAADAPLFRLARKAWSSSGLTPEDIEAEGHRFKPGAGGFATVAVMVDSVARAVPAQADFVPALTRRFRALFEPIPKPENPLQ